MSSHLKFISCDISHRKEALSGIMHIKERHAAHVPSLPDHLSLAAQLIPTIDAPLEYERLDRRHILESQRLLIRCGLLCGASTLHNHLVLRHAVEEASHGNALSAVCREERIAGANSNLYLIVCFSIEQFDCKRTIFFINKLLKILIFSLICYNCCLSNITGICLPVQ
jgi:hypothetical protein